MRSHSLLNCVLLLSLASAPCTVRADETDDELLAGHSHQGEAFNEGPRQAAYLMHGTGDVDFPVTTTSEEAQAFFNQGVGQLHGYWYFEAERSFRQAAKIDPDCGMAYWGMAQANVKNEERARGFIERAYELRDKVTDAERLHIEAYHRFLNEQNKKKDKDRRLRYVKDLEQIVFKHPEQLEARALIGNFFHLHYRAGVKPTSAQAYEDMMQVVLAQQPMHPLHHFRIHLWDDVNQPERGLDAAARCGPSAPTIAHMWHMPAHIFSKLHRYHDAAWQQEASARVDHQHMMRDRVLPDQIHNYAHNNEWLCRNLMNVGRVHDAHALAANMVSLPRHPKVNVPSIGNSSSGYGRKRLTEVLTRFEMWDEMVAALQSADFDRGETPDDESEYLYALGTAQANASDHEAAAETLAELEGLIDELRQSNGEPSNTDGEQSKGEEKKSKRDRAKAERSIKASEERAAEILGLLLLADGDTETALAELEKAKKMDRFQLAVAYTRAGENEKAHKIAESFVKQEPHQVLPAARAAYLFEACGEHEKAEQTFDKLRHLAAEADLDAPLLARLAPLAERLELPADWRIARTPADDLGERPELATLGPFRWSPIPATEWSLADHQGATYKQSDFAGRPVVVIFYLGHGCLHCVEQLHAFAKDAERFESLGIDLIGISSESADQLQQAVNDFGTSGKSIPFPLVCDPQQKTFRTYRCYDDFEDAPLHGTFLIDRQGQVRWHDISYEPFTDVDFLLTESQRLLGQAPASPERLSQR
ncbi:redoxin domain-containing protein [Aeoliella sp.]|uniref:redoxin domain-containing protein n=1 Tax=Aeoliella sp. TaxID=2795800 RepID=UPI003CCBC693